jgi:hypothetical protein
MYTGFECGEHEARVFVCDAEMRVEARDARVDRVAAKVFEEILVNAADCVQRAGGTRVDVTIRPDGFVVENDGSDIPVEFRPEWGVYVPHALFGRMRSSSNYDDTRDRRGAGVNGIGCKLANVFSSRLVVRVTDDDREYEQTFTCNMREYTEPAIEPRASPPRVARVDVTLDLARLTAPATSTWSRTSSTATLSTAGRTSSRFGPPRRRDWPAHICAGLLHAMYVRLQLEGLEDGAELTVSSTDTFIAEGTLGVLWGTTGAMGTIGTTGARSMPILRISARGWRG